MDYGNKLVDCGTKIEGILNSIVGINTSLNTKLDSAGGVVPQKIYFKRGIDVHSAIGNPGESGYIKFCEVTITSPYKNSPFEITLHRRSDLTPSRLSACFLNSGNSYANLQDFTVLGSTIQFYAYKENDSTYSFFAKKSEGYETLDITDVKIPSRLDSGVTISWTDIHASTLPDGCIQARYKVNDISDYIIDQGTVTCSGTGAGVSDITWNYRKWKSGFRELSGWSYAKRSASANGNVYYSSGADNYWYYPADFFSSTPACNITLSSPDYWAFPFIRSTGDSTHTHIVCPGGATSFSGLTFKFDIYVSGY